MKQSHIFAGTICVEGLTNAHTKCKQCLYVKALINTRKHDFPLALSLLNNNDIRDNKIK